MKYATFLAIAMLFALMPSRLSMGETDTPRTADQSGDCRSAEISTPNCAVAGQTIAIARQIGDPD
ncbi:MAG: hypothetical protein MI755_06030 [Sphingomonadales bacterium]|nr:hypothetical protein [Sphingomonadales bacterium]